MTTPQEPTQMTEREMLELAALAAEIAIYFDEDGDCYRVKASGNRRYWNPIDFDGDALRLAVKLGIDIEFEGVEIVFADGNFSEFMKPDPNAATRRAIVRAAAEIGRQMKEKQ